MLAVVGILRREEIPAGQAHHPRPHACGRQKARRVEADLDLAAGADEDALGWAARRFLQDVASPGDSGGGAPSGAVERRHVLPGEHDDRGPVAPFHHRAPRLGHLVGIGGTEHGESRHGPGAGELLDRLVGGAILTEADRIVREHVDDPERADRREPQRRLEIVEEDEERRAVRTQPAQRHAIAGRRHGVLADAEMEVAARAIVRPEAARPRDERHGRWGEIRRAAEEPRHTGTQRLEDLAPRHACRQPLGVRRERGDARVPSRGQATGEEAVELR